jgi:phosphonate transport system substrate-binding protein
MALAALAIACGLVVGCPHQQTGYRPQTLRIGVAPNAPQEFLLKQHGPLARYLQQETGITTELTITEDSDELLAMFHDRRLDMAYLGGYEYVLAHDRDQAVPLAIRDADLRYTSLIIVRADSAARRPEDLRGKRFAFLGQLSTSGHLMPREFLNERGIEPEQFFSETLYSGVHDDAAALWVRDGRVDAGIISREAFARLLATRQITERDVRVLWETPAYADYVWTVQGDLDPRLQAQIQDRLLALASDDPAPLAILEAAGATHFLPAADADYTALRRSVDALSARGTTP